MDTFGRLLFTQEPERADLQDAQLAQNQDLIQMLTAIFTS
jgi:hypothetical protein